jgi:hypothetical protein
MNQKDSAFIKRWQVIRSRGRTRYLFVTGALSWGVPMFLLMTFIVSPPKQMSPPLILLSAIMWLIGGLLFGYVMWIVGERRYIRLTHDERRGDVGGVA